MHSIKIQIDRDGVLFVGAFGLVSILLACFSDTLGWMGLILTVWCAYFFRDPDRVVFQDPHLIVSPADGVVSAIKQVSAPSEWGLGEGLLWRVSIFLNIFDVHVNRTPCQGTVQKIMYHPGKFFNASLDKASEHNERNVLVIDKGSMKVGCVQIAGLIARRIRCDVQENQEVSKGERIGMIRFGSRVDVYLPLTVTPRVLVGQKMISGETILADTRFEGDALQEGAMV